MFNKIIFSLLLTFTSVFYFSEISAELTSSKIDHRQTFQFEGLYLHEEEEAVLLSDGSTWKVNDVWSDDSPGDWSSEDRVTIAYKQRRALSYTTFLNPLIWGEPPILQLHNLDRQQKIYVTLIAPGDHTTTIADLSPDYGTTDHSFPVEITLSDATKWVISEHHHIFTLNTPVFIVAQGGGYYLMQAIDGAGKTGNNPSSTQKLTPITNATPLAGP